MSVWWDHTNSVTELIFQLLFELTRCFNALWNISCNWKGEKTPINGKITPKMNSWSKDSSKSYGTLFMRLQRALLMAHVENERSSAHCCFQISPADVSVFTDQSECSLKTAWPHWESHELFLPTQFILQQRSSAGNKRESEQWANNLRVIVVYQWPFILN